MKKDDKILRLGLEYQPFCRANNINIGFLDGIRVFLEKLQKEA